MLIGRFSTVWSGPSRAQGAPERVQEVDARRHPEQALETAELALARLDHPFAQFTARVVQPMKDPVTRTQVLQAALEALAQGPPDSPARQAEKLLSAVPIAFTSCSETFRLGGALLTEMGQHYGSTQARDLIAQARRDLDRDILGGRSSLQRTLAGLARLRPDRQEAQEMLSPEAPATLVLHRDRVDVAGVPVHLRNQPRA